MTHTQCWTTVALNSSDHGASSELIENSSKYQHHTVPHAQYVNVNAKREPIEL